MPRLPSPCGPCGRHSRARPALRPQDAGAARGILARAASHTPANRQRIACACARAGPRSSCGRATRRAHGLDVSGSAGVYGLPHAAADGRTGPGGAGALRGRGRAGGPGRSLTPPFCSAMRGRTVQDARTAPRTQATLRGLQGSRLPPTAEREGGSAPGGAQRDPDLRRDAQRGAPPGARTGSGARSATGSPRRPSRPSACGGAGRSRRGSPRNRSPRRSIRRARPPRRDRCRSRGAAVPAVPGAGAARRDEDFEQLRLQLAPCCRRRWRAYLVQQSRRLAGGGRGGAGRARRPAGRLISRPRRSLRPGRPSGLRPRTAPSGRGSPPPAAPPGRAPPGSGSWPPGRARPGPGAGTRPGRPRRPRS